MCPDLDTVMQWWQDGKEPEAFQAEYAAGNHLLLYLRERNGLLVWRAYAEYRAAGVAVPENILAKLDQWASWLESASGAAEVARAIEMAPKSGPFGAKHLLAVERRRAIASDVEHLRTHPNYRASLAKIYARIAHERRTTAGNVKRIHAEWMHPARKRSKAAAVSSLGDAMAAMTRSGQSGK